MADELTRLIIKGKRILLPDCVSSGSIIIDKGKIVGIEKGMDTAQLPPRTKVKWGREEALLTYIVTPSRVMLPHESQNCFCGVSCRLIIKRSTRFYA